jgi:Flp pilus assembly protein TadD
MTRPLPPARLLVAVVFATVASLARAQPASPAEPLPTPLPSEYSDEARRSYAQGLVEARRLLDAKNYDEAIARLDALSQARPREAQARFLKAVAQAEAGRSADAVTTLRALASDFPELPEPRNNLAVLYAAQGNYALAREELELAIAAAPDYAIAHENLGDVYARLAAAQYERAAALDRANRSATQKLKLARDLIASSPR